MSTNPDDLRARHRRETKAAAALLLLGRRYNLPALVKQQGKRTRPFRRITPTQALAGSIAAPHLAIAAAWAAERDTLLTAYTSHAAVVRAVDQAASRVANTVMIAKASFRPALDRLEQWHRGQWLSRVKASTGLDVSLFTSPSDVRQPIDDTVAWNQQLADDVHQQTKGRIASGMMVALAAGAPLIEARRVIDEAVAKAQRRAAGIGVDQADKASGSMTRARMTAASVETWRWRHLDPQKHPRPEHQARDGQTYSDDNAPDDLPGMLPFCKCWTEPAFL